MTDQRPPFEQGGGTCSERVAKKLNIPVEYGSRPHETVKLLKEFRDTLDVNINPDDPKAMDARITEVLDQADKLLTAFHQAMPKAVLAVGLTTPPNSREEGFEANYHGKYHRWGWKPWMRSAVPSSPSPVWVLMLKRIRLRRFARW